MNSLQFNTMSSKYRNEVSKNGHRADVLKSLLQKSIRTGNVKMAMYAAGELYSFSFIPGGERLATCFYNRVRIIFIEDIGIGNYGLFEKMIEWMDILIGEREKKAGRNRILELHTIQSIVVALCGSKKTRCCSYTHSLAGITAENQHLFSHTPYHYVPENEETLLGDFDTAMKTKDWKANVYFKRMLTKGNDDKKYRKIVESAMEKYMDLGWMRRWKSALGNCREWFLLYEFPVINYLYSTGEPVELIENTGKPISGTTDAEIFSGLNPELIPEAEFDDTVFDKHVKSIRGNKDIMYFVNISSRVSREIFPIPTDMRDVYVILKQTEHGKKKLSPVKNPSPVKKPSPVTQSPVLTEIPAKETDNEFVVRAQLITGKSKQDTYYARSKNPEDGLLFIKGPYINTTKITDFIQFQELKKEAGLPYTPDAKCVWMIPDYWTEGIPLGLRTSLDITKPHPFLVCQSFYAEEELVIKIHPGSKLWPETRVVDMKFIINPYKLKDAALLDYIHLLVFRLRYNLGDFADRNFILLDGRVYSVDEEITGEKINLRLNMREKKYKFIVDAAKLALEKGYILQEDFDAISAF